jgi:hypothetical protein
MRINNVSDFRKAVRHGPYAWPGGYPVYWVTSDGDALAFKVAKTERRLMLEGLVDNYDSGWRPVALEINWEDENLFCAYTHQRIESAYGATINADT